MSTAIQIKVNEKVFLRDPENTTLGKKIVSHGIELINEIGFEQFTFKKLAAKIDSTEASVYRYFENKHKLLVYLTSWYWGWLDYRINYQTQNIEDPERRLRIIIQVISEAAKDDPGSSHIDESLLHEIVVAESPKAYYTKDVDSENQDGFFRGYKSLCKKIADVLLEINPKYPYPHALVSTALEASHQQIFFSRHLPMLTEVKIKDQGYEPVAKFLETLIFGQIKPNGK